MNKVLIKGDGTPEGTRLTIEGKEIPNVASFTLHQEGGKVPKVEYTTVMPSFEIEAYGTPMSFRIPSYLTKEELERHLITLQDRIKELEDE